MGSARIDGTKESEVIVSDFDTANEILNKLGYFARSKQENRRIQYRLDGVEIDVDFWPMIPPYVEFEAESEEDIKKLCKKLDIDFDGLTSLDVDNIFKDYGFDLAKMPIIELEEVKKNFKA